MSNDIERRARAIIARALEIDPASVTRDAQFVDLGADSLDRITLWIDLEEEFGCEIGDDDWEQIHTLEGAVTFLAQNARQALGR